MDVLVYKNNIVIWILYKPPLFSGKTEVIDIPSEADFKDKVLSKTKPLKNVDNTWLVVFHSNLSDDCIYVYIFNLV